MRSSAGNVFVQIDRRSRKGAFGGGKRILSQTFHLDVIFQQLSRHKV